MTTKVAIAFLSKDRVEQSRQSIESLRNMNFDLYWIDGSDSEEGKSLPSYYTSNYTLDVRGGADAAIVFALSQMLACSKDYTHVGLCEQDVLCQNNWFAPVFRLFERGRDEGLEVGAVSARSYDDRLLIQRDGYAVMLHVGAGHVIFTRAAAEIILSNYRSGHAAENRAVYTRLSGVDIGKFWAFRTNHQWLTADWGFEATLARHGLATLAPIPTCAHMLEDIQPMGLRYAEQPVELLRDDDAFEHFADSTRAVREGKIDLGITDRHFDWFSGNWTIFAHQLSSLGATYSSGWELRWSQGYGPFAYEAAERGATVMMPLFGECHLTVAAGPTAGQLRIQAPGFDWSTTLPPGDKGSLLTVTGDFLDREVTLIALTKGLRFYGVQTRFPQKRITCAPFRWDQLPRVAQ